MPQDAILYAIPHHMVSIDRQLRNVISHNLAQDQVMGFEPVR